MELKIIRIVFEVSKHKERFLESWTSRKGYCISALGYIIFSEIKSHLFLTVYLSNKPINNDKKKRVWKKIKTNYAKTCQQLPHFTSTSCVEFQKSMDLNWLMMKCPSYVSLWMKCWFLLIEKGNMNISFTSKP